MKKIETKSTQFQNAIAKAIETKPLVRPMKYNTGNTTIGYLVRGSSGDFYPVRFQRAGGGAMLGGCLCAGSQRGFHCYHVAAALLAHSAFVRAGLRPQAPQRETSFAPPSHLAWSGSDEVRAWV